MPTYAYRCTGCSKTVEERHPIGKAPELIYHDCGDDFLREAHRVFSAPMLEPSGRHSYKR